MTLNIALTPEAEVRLRKYAARAGKDPVAYAREVLEEQLAEEASGQEPPLSPGQRVAAFLRWVEGHQSTGRPLDDSRESIYAGRGE